MEVGEWWIENGEWRMAVKITLSSGIKLLEICKLKARTIINLNDILPKDGWQKSSMALYELQKNLCALCGKKINK
jgi:hypothetical protein